jgi:SAM-dependent methyltransferase
MTSAITLNKKFSTFEELLQHYGSNGLKLDLGCGYYKPEGYIGIDNGIGFGAQVENQDNFPDLLMDIDNNFLPFEDNSCIEVRASHFLEHSNDGVHVIDEIFRVVHPTKGFFRLVLPYANSALGMYPGHHAFFTEKWFHENIWFQEHWDIRSEVFTPSDYWQKSPWLLRKIIPFDLARIFLFNACDQMELHCYPKELAV